MIKANPEGHIRERRLHYSAEGWSGTPNKEQPMKGNSIVWYEPTRWWMHIYWWRLGLSKIFQMTKKAITHANKSLDTPIGKILAAIIVGTTVFVLGRYIYERAGF